MEAKASITRKKTLSKCFFLLLAVSGFIVIFCFLDPLKFKYEEITNTKFKPPQPAAKTHPAPCPSLPPPPPTPPPPPPKETLPFCYFEPLSSADAEEERHLLNVTAWPETPVWQGLPPMQQTADPAHSSFTILPGSRDGGQWQVGDQLEVMINLFNVKGQAKMSGGDFLTARLHNRTLEAGVVGRVVDHFNGSYSAIFPLLWTGDAQVQVTLIHPSEAVTVLDRLPKEQPDMASFRSVFRSGSISRTTTCNVCLRDTGQPVCNFTDPLTGEPWFCYKPENLSCDTRATHVVGRVSPKLRAAEENLFRGGFNMKVFIKSAGSAFITVLPQGKDQPTAQTSPANPGVSGFYYQGVWRGVGGNNVMQFDTPPAMTQCLKGKILHMFGDSTVRQWFEYITAFLPGAKQFNMDTSKQVGPLMTLDHENKILINFRIHGPPLRCAIMPSSELHYIANEIDSISGGNNKVLIFGIWAHFGTYPIELYIRRLQTIRKAVVRLLNRAPGTVVIIRTPNAKALSTQIAITNGDWFSLQEDKVLRTMFKGLNVHLVDCWEMVLAHSLPHLLHPQPPIIKNMVNVALSYICPKKAR